jgi:hypothetical protein
MSSGMLRRVTLVRTDVSEELSTSIIRVIRIRELGKTLAVTINWRTLRRNTMHRLLVTANIPISRILATLMMEALSSSKPSVLTRATRRIIPEDDILHGHRRENLKSYTIITFRKLDWFPKKAVFCFLGILRRVLLVRTDFSSQRASDASNCQRCS